VAAFAKVVHIGCMLRLVWRNFEQQRGSRLRREQTLTKKRLCSAVLLGTLLLAGCNTFKQTGDDIGQDKQQTDQLREQMGERSQPFAVLKHGRAKIAGEEIRLKEEKEELPELFTEQISYITSGQTLEETLEALSRQMGLPIWLTEFASEGAARKSGSSDDDDNPGRIPIHIQYEGSLQGLLDQLAQSGRLYWRYHEGRVEFFLYETRHFYVNLPMGLHSVESSISSASSGGGGGEGGGSTQQDTGELKIKMEGVSINPYSVVTRAVAAILMEEDQRTDVFGAADFEVKELEGSNSGNSSSSDSKVSRGINRVVVAPEMAMISVTAQPQALDRVADYIEQVNRRFSRNVMIDVKIYDLSLNDSAGLGFNLADLFKKMGKYGLSIVGGGDVNIIRPPGGTETTLSAFVRALSDFGKTSLVTSGQVIAINGQPAPLQIGSETSYISSVEARERNIAGGVTVTDFVPTSAKVSTGLTANFVPQMLADNRILLQYQLTSRSLSNMRPGPNGIELPEVDSQTLNQQAFVRDGEAIVLFGFERDNKRLNGDQSVLASASRAANNDRTLRVIVMQVFGGGANGNAAHL
ncbi:type II secretion system protein GspD, partial [Ventosimonas gracilis]